MRLAFACDLVTADDTRSTDKSPENPKVTRIQCQQRANELFGKRAPIHARRKSKSLAPGKNAAVIVRSNLTAAEYRPLVGNQMFL